MKYNPTKEGNNMRKRVEGVQEKILECALEEFLEKGFTDASLRTIAEKAETSTNSIYVRFGDKEGVFSAIVEPVVQGMKEMFQNIQETFHSFDKETQKCEVGQYSSNEMENIIDYIYDNFDVFRLLLDASYGTRFHNFVDWLVSIEEEYTYKWLEVTGYVPQMEGTMTKELLHMVFTSYFEGIFEVVRHGINREDAKKYIGMLGTYHHAGFLAILKSNS